VEHNEGRLYKATIKAATVATRLDRTIEFDRELTLQANGHELLYIAHNGARNWRERVTTDVLKYAAAHGAEDRRLTVYVMACAKTEVPVLQAKAEKALYFRGVYKVGDLPKHVADKSVTPPDRKPTISNAFVMFCSGYWSRTRKKADVNAPAYYVRSEKATKMVIWDGAISAERKKELSRIFDTSGSGMAQWNSVKTVDYWQLSTLITHAKSRKHIDDRPIYSVPSSSIGRLLREGTVWTPLADAVNEGMAEDFIEDVKTPTVDFSALSLGGARSFVGDLMLAAKDRTESSPLKLICQTILDSVPLAVFVGAILANESGKGPLIKLRYRSAFDADLITNGDQNVTKFTVAYKELIETFPAIVHGWGRLPNGAVSAYTLSDAKKPSVSAIDFGNFDTTVYVDKARELARSILHPTQS
jgi:hypothetical protein